MEHNKQYHIATLITCHNRKEKTIKSLRALFNTVDRYNQKKENFLYIKIFLTDDGCTDGTVDYVLTEFSNRDISILEGNGKLYWAGGMRVAWNEALKEQDLWNFYFLLNDDTFLNDNVFEELFHTHTYAINKYGKGGIYSGITCSQDGKEITYGGKVYKTPFIGKAICLKPSGVPQKCQMTNANILLVTKNVVEKIGIFDTCYQHSCADWAYSIMATKAGFPVLVTANICGICNNDHDSELEEQKQIIRMSIKERKNYFSSPLKSISDVLAFMWRFNKIKFILTLVARWLNIYFPKFYYAISRKRPH